MATFSGYEMKPQMQCERMRDGSPIQGCGDRSCKICFPEGRPDLAGGALGGGGRDPYLEARRALDRQMYAAVLSSALGMQQNSNLSESDQERRRLERAEKQAREPIAEHLLKSEHAVAWEDVIGNEAAREALTEVIEEPIRHAELYAAYGMKPTKGVLLCGPPGCGKTMLGKACASALARLYGKGGGSTLLLINGPAIQSPFVGQTEEKIRQIFAYARAYRALHGHPLLIFVDEADAIVPSRERNSNLPWVQSNVATFLTEMDGLETSGAFVVMATNRPEVIDAAILRDGRCDRKVFVERPDQHAFQVIVGRALAGVPTMLPQGELAVHAADRAFSPLCQLKHFVTNDDRAGCLLLKDIVSGAMAEGLAQRVKAAAFRRDRLAGAGATGATRADVDTAVAEIERENKTLPHIEAMVEVGTRMGAAFILPAQAQVARSPAISPEEQRRMMN